MQESEDPPSYDEATKVQTFEDEHADPYLIQAKHEGGFEQSDENLTKEGYESPEAEKVHSFKEDDEERIIKTPSKPFDQSEVDIKTTTEIVTQEIPGGYVETQRITVEEDYPEGTNSNVDSEVWHSQMKKSPELNFSSVEGDGTKNVTSSPFQPKEHHREGDIITPNELIIPANASAEHNTPGTPEAEFKEFLTEDESTNVGDVAQETKIDSTEANFKQEPGSFIQGEDGTRISVPHIVNFDQQSTISVSGSGTSEDIPSQVLLGPIQELTTDTQKKEINEYCGYETEHKVYDVNTDQNKTPSKTNSENEVTDDIPKYEEPFESTEQLNTEDNTDFIANDTPQIQENEQLVQSPEETPYSTISLKETEHPEMRKLLDMQEEPLTQKPSNVPYPESTVLSKRKESSESLSETEQQRNEKSNEIQKRETEEANNFETEITPENVAGANKSQNYEYPETPYAEEADKSQKGDEIEEEPLQQRPADIPYPEEKYEGPGLATKIAGAVAGVTVGGAILAYNKVKDAIGGNDDESEFPSEHQTPEAHYFEEHEKIMQESEAPPSYDEATKVQTFEDEHADPYLIQAKHEGGFEQSDENLTKEGYESPEAEKVHSFKEDDEERIIKTPSEPFDQSEVDIKTTTEIVTQQIPGGYVETQRITVEEVLPANEQQEFVHSESIDDHSHYEKTPLQKNEVTELEKFSHGASSEQFEHESSDLSKMADINDVPLQQTQQGMQYRKEWEEEDDSNEYSVEGETFEEQEVLEDINIEMKQGKPAPSERNEEEIQRNSEDTWIELQDQKTKEFKSLSEHKKDEVEKESPDVHTIDEIAEEPLQQQPADIQYPEEKDEGPGLATKIAGVVAGVTVGGAILAYNKVKDAIGGNDDESEYPTDYLNEQQIQHSGETESRYADESERITHERGIPPPPYEDQQRYGMKETDDEREPDNIHKKDDFPEGLQQTHVDLVVQKQEEGASGPIETGRAVYCERDTGNTATTSAMQKELSKQNERLISPLHTTESEGREEETPDHSSYSTETQSPALYKNEEDKKANELEEHKKNVPTAVTNISRISDVDDGDDYIIFQDAQRTSARTPQTPEIRITETSFTASEEEYLNLPFSASERDKEQEKKVESQNILTDDLLTEQQESVQENDKFTSYQESEAPDFANVFKKDTNDEEKLQQEKSQYPTPSDSTTSNKQQQMDSYNYEYPDTSYAEEADKLQKGDEIAEEPLQQRPADIPYPEEKDEGPGLATKIAGAVAGVTVGGAILAYNKVKDAIGGNDEESEYPSEHQTPEEHYFEKHEQIMQESEAPPSYDEATKVQTFEDEHADPYLIQAKHEGGFEQSDENLTKEGYESPEAEIVHSFKEDDEERIIKTPSEPFDQSEVDIKTTTEIVTQEIPGGYVETQRITVEEVLPANEQQEFVHSESIGEHAQYEEIAQQEKTYEKTKSVNDKDTKMDVTKSDESDEESMVQSKTDVLEDAGEFYAQELSDDNTFSINNRTTEEIKSENIDNEFVNTDQNDSQKLAYEYPLTTFAGEAFELQKGDEIAEEPLQQRPADIPYPEEKDEGPGLATKIAGAVAGVTVGGAILAYNKVKDAIGGNDEESEYPSEHQTPEAHYFEKHEQIMQESEAPPSYDEATKVQTFEDEHADPYLIQSKHEGGFEQSDENVLSTMDNSVHITGREEINNERNIGENLLHFEKSVGIDELSTKSLRSEPYAIDEVEERTNEVVSSPEEVEAPLIEIEQEQHAQREESVSEIQKNETKTSARPSENDENLQSAEKSHHIAQEVAGAVAGAAFSGAYLAYENAEVNNVPLNYDTRSSMEDTWSSREQEDAIAKDNQRHETFEDIQTQNDYKEDDKEILTLESSSDLPETAEDVLRADKNEQMQNEEGKQL
uniref:Uncharacterized protein n=1 Tax=Panagrolaimus davidi TaxID=227884 RepID=A0A914R9N1_9BILA